MVEAVAGAARGDEAVEEIVRHRGADECTAAEVRANGARRRQRLQRGGELERRDGLLVALVGQAG